MKINRSSRYNELGEFWYDGRKVDIQRIWGGIAFEGNPLFAVVLGEEQFFNQTHYYILAEGQAEEHEGLADIITMCKRLEAEYKVKRWMGFKDDNIERFLVIMNKASYNSGISNFLVMNAPRRGDYIDEGIALVHSLVTPQDKRLHFYNESMIPSELKALPSIDIKASQWPRATALANVIGGMLLYCHENISSEDLVPEPEESF